MIITYTHGIVSLFILFALFGPMALAQNADIVMPLDPPKAAEQQDVRRQTLDRETAEIARLSQEFGAYEAGIQEQTKTLGVDQLTDAMVEQAQVDFASIQLEQKDLKGDLVTAERRIDELTASINQLKTQQQLLKNPAKDEVDDAKRLDDLRRARLALAQQQIDLELERQHLENLRNRAELVTKRLTLIEQWKSRVDEVARLKEEQSRLEAQEDLKQRSQRQQQDYKDQVAEFKQRLETEGSTLSEFQRRLLQTRIQGAEEQAKLAQNQPKEK